MSKHSEVTLPEGLSYRLIHQNLAIVVLRRPDSRNRGFEGTPLGDNLYAVARYVTYVHLVDRAGQVISEGQAICAPYDPFDPDLGLRIAAGRAYKDYIEQQQGIELQLVLSPGHTHYDSNPDPINWFGDSLYG